MNTLAAPVYYPSPNVSRPASQLTEEEQVSEFDKVNCVSDVVSCGNVLAMQYPAAILTDFAMIIYVPPHMYLSGENRPEDRSHPAPAYRHL